MAPKTIRLRAYRPELVQRAHCHQGPHLSLVIAGSFHEQSRGAEQSPTAGCFAVRSTEFEHQVRFGQRGALVLSMNLSLEQFSLAEAQYGLWGKAPASLVRNVMIEALGAATANEVEESVWDALAGLPDRDGRRPSQWLLSAREALVEDGATISAIACRAGVHRVHFSRAFTRAFGLPPSAYRRNMRALRAAAAAMNGAPAARSAYECGFADQSHMARAIRQVTGGSYTRLRHLGSKVTSVQD